MSDVNLLKLSADVDAAREHCLAAVMRANSLSQNPLKSHAQLRAVVAADRRASELHTLWDVALARLDDALVASAPW